MCESERAAPFLPDPFLLFLGNSEKSSKSVCTKNDGSDSSTTSKNGAQARRHEAGYSVCLKLNKLSKSTVTDVVVICPTT